MKDPEGFVKQFCSAEVLLQGKEGVIDGLEALPGVGQIVLQKPQKINFIVF